MNEKNLRREVRRSINPVGWPLVIYYLIMNVAVMFVAFAQSLWITLTTQLSGDGLDTEVLTASLLSNGWGYILAVAVGLIVLLCWKGISFWKNEIWAKNRPMTMARLGVCTVIMFGCQLLASIWAYLLELLLKPLGISVLTSMESASPAMNTVSMYLYVGILAPISEEILFRGLIQRLMMPYGKKAAIFCSAFLFGLFHGNLVQSPYAFLIGLILGYVTAEHSILWAIVLHMLNNILMGDVLERAVSGLPEKAANYVVTGIFAVFTVAGIFLLVRNLKTIRKEMGPWKIDRRMLLCFFTNPGVVALTVMMVANMAMMLFL